MKNTAKRFVAIFLVMAMLISLSPTVFAAETEELVDTNLEITIPTEANETPDETIEVATEAPECGTESNQDASEASEDDAATVETMEPVEEETSSNGVANYLLTQEAIATAANTSENMLAANMRVISVTKNQIANGVSYEKIVSKNGNGQQNIGYLTKVDLSKNVTIKAAYGGYYAAGSTSASRKSNASKLGWSLSKTTILAKEYEAAGDIEGTVVMATNGDYFNMGTGEPLGYLVMEGNILKTSNEPYFAILKDGTAVIRDAGVDVSDVQEAISGPFYLIKDGQIVADKNDTSHMPRNSVGVCADGSVVFYLNDGRQAPTSEGMTLYETASVLKDAGCVTALYLDGGGSATVAARPEGGKLKVVNSPSDGSEREVSSAVLIVSTADATGVFDHAALTPYDELYTPNSKVQFSALGVDASGAAADMPTDVKWALATDSQKMGEIDNNGLFISNGECGTVNVELLLGDKVVGTTSVEIVTPDELVFNSDEISLGFEETTDFNLTARYQEREVHIKDGDIRWSITENAMGEFNGNYFTSSDGKSLNGDVTATSAYDQNVSASIHVIVGMLPTIVWDFEDVTTEDGTVIAAEEYYTGDSGILTHANYGRGGKESVEIVSIDDGEPVRFGEKALKLNYDFTQCGEVTEGAVVGTTEGMEIPGVPTAIGVWVYAPEGTGITWEGDGTQSGFWLRGYLEQGNGKTQVYDFTFEPKDVLDENSDHYGMQPGVYWEGWHYCEADLTNIQPPYKILRGNTFRLMYVAGTGMGTKTAGSIYFDNLQFVYGTNVDDTDNPLVDSIKVDNKELKSGDVLSDNQINTIRVSFSDVQNKYTSGVDGNTVRVYIDGVNVRDNDQYEFAIKANDGYAELYNLQLIDGEHAITVSLRDNYGNETEETRYFTVKSNGTTELTTVRVSASEKYAPLGGTVTLNLSASASDVTEVSASVRLDKLFTDTTIEFAEGYEGSYKIDKQTNTVTIDAKRKAQLQTSTYSLTEETLQNVIAQIHVKVPTTLSENTVFTCEVKGVNYKTEDGFFGTFAASREELAVSAKLSVSSETILVGSNARIKVKDHESKPVAGAKILVADTNEVIGTTDENGVWETDRYSKTPTKESIYATLEDGSLSFQYTIISYAPQGDAELASSIVMNACANNTTQKNISWISSPVQEGKQQIQYRLEGQNDENWYVTYASTSLKTFDKGGDYKAANFNRVTLRNLQPGKTYEYRIGNGSQWTDLGTFCTSDNDDMTKFFVMADVQADDRTNVNNIIKNVQNGGYDFGIQTGDAIDDPTSYDQVLEASELFGINQLGMVDMIHVLGNHEYAGDTNALVSKQLFGLPSSTPGSYYSMTYGNVYVAVINYSGTTADLIESLEWLVEDAQASDAVWKVLAIHQPAYYTNANGGNGPINMYVPEACEKAGINVVFSGHDHSLARTNPLKNGQIDEENGIIYLIGGSSGEKSYAINSNTVFDYEKIFAVVTGNFNATYISCTADAYQMTINLMDVNTGGGEFVVDSYTIYNSVGACIRDGHVWDDQPTAKDGAFHCTNCGLDVKFEDSGFTGWAKDGTTGRAMYFIGGEYQTGAFLLERDTFYFDENGIALDGELLIDEVPMTFDNGKLVDGYSGFFTKKNEKTYHYVNGEMTFGWYQEDGRYYHFDAETGVMCTGTHVMPDAEALSKNAYYDFDVNGVLLHAYFNPAGYYYWAGLPLADAWVQTGVRSEDPDAWYRTNASGHFVRDPNGGKEVVIAIDGVEYTFDNNNGKLLKGSIVNDNGTLYYYWAGNPVNDGWFDLDGKTYYAFEDGHLAAGSAVIDGKGYMFSIEGQLITEGAIAYAELTDNYHRMSIHLTNVEDLNTVRFAIWIMENGAEDGVQWINAQKDKNGVWSAELPMCLFDAKTAEIYSIHAYGTTKDADRFLVGTTVDVPVAATHAFDDNTDDTCNYCGFVRELPTDEDAKPDTYTPMYRLYNPNTGEHHYTGSTEERETLELAGWQYEGVAWNAPIRNGAPVYRVYNPNSGDHHYTMSETEIANLVELGWQYEGVAWNCAEPDATNIMVYRLYNPNAKAGIHHYTNSEEERNDLVSLGWKYEGIGWYGVPAV